MYYLIVAIVYNNVSDVYTHTVNKIHFHLSLNCLISLQLILIFNGYCLSLHHACKHPVILKLCL